jgi:hypothetical protein
MNYDIDNIFTYHPCGPEKEEKYVALRNEAKTFAKMILDMAPETPERTLALRKVEEAVMWANASIARN